MVLLEVLFALVLLGVIATSASLVMASRGDVPRLVRDAEAKFDEYRRAHPVRHRSEHRIHRKPS